MVYATSQIEEKLWDQGYKQVCGVDEVGRGSFAGPVVVGAVIFSPNYKIPEGLADSKLLKSKIREELDIEIKESCLGWSIAEISLDVINEVGIGEATQLAFLSSIKLITPQPDFVIIDAFLIKNYAGEQQAVASGDKLSVSIAAASIIAKVYRDNLMVNLHAKCPEYGFDVHKGYGTKAHRDAIKIHGLSNLHRKSFKLDKFT